MTDWQDNKAGSNIVCTFLSSGDDQWIFGGDEMNGAPPAVKAALQDNEALAFRDDQFPAAHKMIPSLHEFEAMARSLVGLLGHNVVASASSLSLSSSLSATEDAAAAAAAAADADGAESGNNGS